MFSDECLVRQFNPMSVRIRRPKNSRWKQRYIVSIVKHSFSIMIWGAITARGRSGLYVMPPSTTVNVERYLNIIQEKVPHWLEVRQCSVLQHDGVPCHQARSVKAWLQQQRFRVLAPWPRSSLI